VRTQLLQTLQDEGLERIPVLGLAFDPALSEAVQTQPVEDPDQHQLVVKELLRGYRLKGRIARASRVVVGVYGEADAVAVAPLAGRPVQAVEELPGEGIQELPDDDLEVLPGSSPADDQLDISPPSPPGPPAQAPKPESELSLEEIVARAEARETLRPAGRYSGGGNEGDEGGQQ